jgi:hypothetical protein
MVGGPVMTARWPAGLHVRAGSLPARRQPNRRIDVTPNEQFRMQVRAPLANNSVQTTVDGNGRAVAQIGPQGLGTRWWVAQANVQTSSGALDTSTVAIYLGAQIASNLLGASSYAGGQDTIGVHSRPLTPGDLITAVWSNATPGDIATLTVYGDQDVLAAP